MRKETIWRRLFLLLLVTVTLSACTDSDDSLSDSPQSTALDEGPSFTDKAVDVNRDGNAYGQVSLRFYSDKPSVAYISVAEFYRIMTGGETMKVERQGDLYKLTGHDGAATVDVKDDRIHRHIVLVVEPFAVFKEEFLVEQSGQRVTFSLVDDDAVLGELDRMPRRAGGS